MAGKTLSFYNITGGLNTVQDLATINSTPNRTESPDMKNIEYYKYGGIKTMKGNRNILSTPLVTDDGIEINCGYEYLSKGESTMVVVDGWSRVYRYDPATKSLVNVITYAKANGWTVEDGNDYFKAPTSGNYQTLINDDSMGSGYIEGQERQIRRHSITSYNNGIIVTNGYSLLYYNLEDKVIKNYIPRLVQTITSESGAESQLYIPIQSNVIAAYKGRLFLANDKLNQFYNKSSDTVPYTNTLSYDNTLYYSGVGYGDNTNETYWTEGAEESDAGRFNNFFGDNSLFTGLMPWSEYLVIHKSKQTYLLDGTSSDSTQWILSPYSHYSVDSQQGIVVANSAYYGYVRDAGGIYPILQRTIYNSTFEGGELSFKIKDSFKYIDLENLQNIYATFHPLNNWIMFYVPTLTNGLSNHCYIYDIKTKTWLYREVPQDVTCAFKFDNKVYIGTRDGLVLEEFYGTSFNGEPIEFYWLSPSYMWGGGTNNTTTSEFRTKLVNEYTNHFYVESLRDGNTIATTKRLISNSGDNLSGLIWDIGILGGEPRVIPTTHPETMFDFLTDNIGDFNPDNYVKVANGYNIKQVPTIVWAYETTEGTTYYSKDNPLKSYSKLYSDSKLTYFVGYYNDKQFVQRDPNGDLEFIDYVTNTAYAWQPQVVTDICFRNSNGVMAWVPVGGSSSCRTNLKTQTTTTTQIYAFYGVDNNGQRNGYYVGVDNLSDANKIVNGTMSPIKMYYLDDNNWNRTFSSNGNSLYVYGARHALYGTATGWGVGAGLPMNQDSPTTSGFVFTWSFSQGTFNSLRLERATSKDKTTTVYTEIPSGTSPLSITKTYTPTNVTENTTSITINVNGTPTVLQRYSAGDFKKAVGTNIIYTNTSTPTTSDKASSSLSMEGNLTISSVGSGYINIGTIQYLRYPSGDNSYTTEAPYKASNILAGLTPTQIESTTRIYDYYADYLKWNTNKSLTDSVWDDNSWLAQGYQTKRFLLPNQYFQTIQYRFSGEALTDSICIAGFEVDGIQLTEVPY